MSTTESSTTEAENLAFMEALLAKVDSGVAREALETWERELLANWNLRMLRTYVESRGARTLMDQDCPMHRDVPTGPLAEVAAPWRLSEDDIARFYRDGYLGPFTAISPGEMADFRRQLHAELARPSATFGFQTVRDRHFDLPAMMDLFRHPAITERLAQLLGPDLLLWRSQVFPQPPGSPAVTFHQATTYMAENYLRPLLQPPDPGRVFQLTTWIAVDEAARDNGCMQFVPGSHWETRAARRGGDEGFFETRFKLELDPERDRIVDMELAPGQFVIFTERGVHGSPGNPSSRPRMGLNFRAICPHTRVYEGMTEHSAFHLQQTWSLDRWGVYVLRGRNEPALNRLAPAPGAALP